MSKGHQSIVVTTSPARVLPGASIQVSVAVTGEPDGKVGAASVRLLCTVTSQKHEIGVVADYDASSDDTHEVGSAPFDPAPGTSTTTLTVPADALPTAASGVTWEASAVIERHHGFDVKGKVPFTVLAPLRADAPSATRPEQRGGDDLLDLVVDQRTVRPGDEVTGTVTLRPGPPDPLNNVTVGFNVVDGFNADPTEYHDQRMWVLAREVSADPQQARVYPFTITVPANVPPTVDGSALTPPSPVRVLVSVLANADRPRRMASNYVALELNVFNTPDVDAG